MVDIDLILQKLRALGHAVEHPHAIPSNAGDYEFTVDGKLLTLAEVRSLLEADQRP